MHLVMIESRSGMPGSGKLKELVQSEYHNEFSLKSCKRQEAGPTCISML